MSNHDENETHFEGEKLPEGVVLKEHCYDGIREYDQRLPRWWLLTLYGAIAFSALYWLVDHNYMKAQTTTEKVEQELADIATIKLANSIDVTDNSLFWEMSENATFVSAGKAIYEASCTPCHGANLEGGIGFNLVDGEWVHGAQPSSIYTTIYDGVPDKGMQAWGTQLGQKRITEVVAYVLSKNDRSTMEVISSEK